MPKILVWQWGRYGAGPRIAFELAGALERYCGMDVLLSLARDAELLESPLCRDATDLPIETYTNKGQFALRTMGIGKIIAPLLRRIEQERPSAALLIMPGYWDLFLVRHLQCMGIPVVIIIHDAANHPGDRFQLVQWIQKRLIANSQAVITLTDHVAHGLDQRGLLKNKIHHIIPHPVLAFPDLKLAKPQPSQYQRAIPLRLLLAGRLRKYKGVELLLQAISQIDPVHLEVRIVGSLSDMKLVERAKQFANVELFEGWQSEEELMSHIDWSHAVILPYSQASQSGIIPLAYSRRRAVIATPVGGLSEQVKHQVTGLLTTDVSSRAIAEAISQFINDPDMLNTYGENAYQCAQNEWNWKSIAHLFSEVLNEVIQEK